jgi:hypothetical protein
MRAEGNRVKAALFSWFQKKPDLSGR